MSLGITEILLIMTVILLLFGAKRIPELARAFGKAKSEFERAKTNIQNETNGLAKDFKMMAENEEAKSS